MSDEAPDPVAHFSNLTAAYQDNIRTSDFKANLVVLFVAIMMGPIVGYRENYPSYHAQVRLINSYNSMLNTTSTTMLSTSNKRIGTFNTLVDSEYVANWMSGRSKRGVEHRNESDDDSEIADDTDTNTSIDSSNIKLSIAY